MSVIELSSRPIDPNVKQRRASDPECSVWVGASAGTGKTKVLTDRVLRLMLAGTQPSRILCLTFTKAAAAEMSIRINNTLARWATLPDSRLEDNLTDLTGDRPDADMRTRARRLFAQVVDCPGGMKIQTIHAFCQSLLRRFSLEADLAPQFDVMDERTADELLAAARDTVLARSRFDQTSELGKAVTRLTRDIQQDDFADILKSIAMERGRIRRIIDHHGGLDATIAAVFNLLKVPPGADETSILKQACHDDMFDVPALRDACRALSSGSNTDQERGIGIQAWLDAAETRIERFHEFVKHFLTTEGFPRKTLLTKKPATANPAALQGLMTEAERLCQILDRVKSAGVANSTSALLVLAEALIETYTQLKADRSRLDYDDLILAAQHLLTKEGVAPWVLFKLDGGLDHILIDEAQDTNPEQWQVVAALAEEFFANAAGSDRIRTLFAVGDEKQSIYSFQRADPAEFARMRGHFQSRVELAEGRWHKIDLEISFRSTAAVLDAVDAVFALQTARDGVAFESSTTIRHVAFRRGHAGLVELWPPVTPQEREAPAPWEPPLTRQRTDSPPARLAAVIADTIRDWLENREELPARGRAIRPGDVMVLVRRRTGFVEELVRALKERHVPVAGVDRMVLTQQLSIMDLMALANFLLLPEDDLTLATILKSPLIGLTEEQLFDLAHPRKGTLWKALRTHAEADTTHRPVHDYLRRLLNETDFIRPFELFARVLNAPCPADEVSGRRAILKRLGPDAQDPLDEFLSACLAFERSHAPSLQSFLHWLEASEAEIKRELEQGSDRVRIMTVHGSKGLQAPIVFLPDSMGVPTQSPRILWPEESDGVPLFAPRRAQEDGMCNSARRIADQRRDQEYRRLLYVALTRAEDRLYICGWQGKKDPNEACWYRLAEQALREIGEPCNYDFTALSPQDGWSGEGWRLRGAQTMPAKDDNLDADRETAPSSLPQWARAPAPDEPTPFRPLTPSRPEEPEPAVRSPMGNDNGARFLRGTLIHRLLQTLPDLDPALQEAACRRFLARSAHNLTPEGQALITNETLAVLRDPTFAPLFGPGSRAEVPVVGVVSSRALSGQIDRLLVTDEAVWIVDYKTNRPPPLVEAEVSPVYLRQMAAYRAALSAIYPDRPIRCVLLWTDGPRLMELSPGLLDGHGP
jgi:ATP-dependent helicase/nuclease subunit A